MKCDTDYRYSALRHYCNNWQDPPNTRHARHAVTGHLAVITIYYKPDRTTLNSSDTCFIFASRAKDWPANYLHEYSLMASSTQAKQKQNNSYTVPTNWKPLQPLKTTSHWRNYIKTKLQPNILLVNLLKKKLRLDSLTTYTCVIYKIL